MDGSDAGGMRTCVLPCTQSCKGREARVHSNLARGRQPGQRPVTWPEVARRAAKEERPGCIQTWPEAGNLARGRSKLSSLNLMPPPACRPSASLVLAAAPAPVPWQLPACPPSVPVPPCWPPPRQQEQGIRPQCNRTGNLRTNTTQVRLNRAQFNSPSSN